MARRSFPLVFHVLHALERLFARGSLHPEQEVYGTDDFPWVRALEADWLNIRAELERVLAGSEPIPGFQEISPEQAAITQGDHWQTYVLHAWGLAAGRNCRECPRTAAAVARIPGMKTAFFSILGAGRRIAPHRGPYKGLLRCHLGLVVPEPEKCGIRVGATQAHWQEGRALIFDDTFEHEAWNDGAAPRVVLFIDFVRPLRWPLSAINAAILSLVAHSAYGRRVARGFARWYEARGIDADVRV